MTSNSQECGRKKVYQRPNLRVYGDIRALTQSVGGASKMADGGMGKSANKTA